MDGPAEVRRRRPTGVLAYSRVWGRDGVRDVLGRAPVGGTWSGWFAAFAWTASARSATPAVGSARSTHSRS
jgi:hypothetical protein